MDSIWNSAPPPTPRQLCNRSSEILFQYSTQLPSFLRASSSTSWTFHSYNPLSMSEALHFICLSISSCQDGNQILGLEPSTNWQPYACLNEHQISQIHFKLMTHGDHFLFVLDLLKDIPRSNFSWPQSLHDSMP